MAGVVEACITVLELHTLEKALLEENIKKLAISMRDNKAKVVRV